MDYHFWKGVLLLMLGTGGILTNVRVARNIKAQGCNQRIVYYIIAGLEFLVALWGVVLLIEYA